MSNFKTIPISVELIDDNLNTIDAYRKIEATGFDLRNFEKVEVEDE